MFFLGPPRCLPWRKSGGGLFSDPERRRAVAKVLREKYNELGPFSYAEKNVIALFVVLIALWLFRSPGFMTGWGDALKTGGATGEIGNILTWSLSLTYYVAGGSVTVRDPTPAIFVVILLFIVPADKEFFRHVMNVVKEH